MPGAEVNFLSTLASLPADKAVIIGPDAIGSSAYEEAASLIGIIPSRMKGLICSLVDKEHVELRPCGVGSSRQVEITNPGLARAARSTRTYVRSTERANGYFVR